MTSVSAWDVAADIFDPPAVEPTDPEAAACAASAEHFIEGHCTIEEPDGTVLPFELWDFQRDDVIAALEQGQSIIVLKARRLGLSWVVLAFILWLAIFRQGTRILVLCKTGDDAAELLDRIRRMRDRIATNPDSAIVLQGIPPTAKSRDAVTTLDIGTSTIRALMGTPAAARSETAGFVLLDEFGFQRGAGEIWRAIYPTIEGGGQVGVVSTGNGPEVSAGIGAEFAALWSRAKRGTTALRPLFFPWMARPSRDAAWKADTIATLGDPDRFRVEYPETEEDAFLSPDADLVIPPAHVDAIARHGAAIDKLPMSQRPSGPLRLGIDWGVHTHILLARRMASGGLYVFAEVVDSRGDLDSTARKLDAVLPDAEQVAHESFDSAEPIVHGEYRKAFRARHGYAPKWSGIHFAKFKRSAIKYTVLLARRANENESLRYLAVSPTGCPVLLQQMSLMEWKDTDKGITEKGNDHGFDALLTLTAELGFEMYGTDINTDDRG